MPTPTGIPVLSGFCSNGQHEGTRPKSYTGQPLKVCTLDVCTYCECNCHKDIDKMFEMSDMERVPVDNPEWVPFKRTYWMPSDEPDWTMDLPTPAPEINDEGVIAQEREIVVTPTGRTSRGGLEFWVQRECLAWLVDREPTYCTVRFLSEEIGRVEGINPPSQGAIAAVFDRWVKYGYAVIDKKPARFSGLTDQGEKMGLDWCRANFKKSSRAR